VEHVKKELSNRIFTLRSQADREARTIAGLLQYAEEREKARATLVEAAEQMQQVLTTLGGEIVEYPSHPLDRKWEAQWIERQLTRSTKPADGHTINVKVDGQTTETIARAVERILRGDHRRII
jgi:hypothetical protein